MDFDQTQAIYDYEEDEEEQVEDEKANPKKKEVAHLKVFSQQGFKETIFPVFQGDNVLGRDGKCNITVPIKALSKKHACIEVQRDLHLIYDCGSKNRTKKGKSFLKPTVRYELKHGDMLTLGDVKCQYLVGLDMEEEDDEETGSSESMLQDVNTEEELDVDKPNLTEDASTSKKIDERGSILTEELLQEDHQMAKPTKDDEEAYAADTDSDTDEERPIAVAAMPTVLYSSEDEQETPQRQQAPSVTSKGNGSMEGQTLAFGLGSPGNVFQSRDSTGSSGSHPGHTASIPSTLMVSTESDSQSDGKQDVPSDQENKPSPFKHPGARGSGTQPPCEPTLVYGSESDDGSPIKRPKHPEARVSDKGLSCEPEPTLLYGSESDDGTPKKKPRQPGASNEPNLLYESDSEEGTGVVPKESDARGGGHHATDDQTLLYSEASEGKPPSIPAISSGDVGDSSPGESAEERPDNKQEATVAVKDSDATLPYAEAEMSSTDDEDESESVVTSSSAGTTEQMDGISKTPEGKDKTQLTKPTTRKGRRGAMRVTIEPEEPQEEEERETSTRKGRKGVMVVTDEPEVQEENVTKGTAGGKRGRQTAKTTSIVEEEEEETPVTKSRRGQRGKAAQAESTSVSETPLKTPTGPAAVQDVAVVVEPLNVRRGGRGRGRNGATAKETAQEVEETPAKKSRRGKEPAVNRSPSLNRGKPSVGSSPKIMFTGLLDKQGEKVVTSLGGQLVDNIHNCTHLVTDKVRRTVKFLCGLASGQIIVLPSWLDACKKAKSFVDTSPFLVKDKDAEKQYKFNLQRSHEVALTKSLLEGYKIHVTKKVKPEPSQMKDIIQSAKGEFLSSMPRSKDDRVFVISCEEDRSVCKKPLEAGIPVVSAEVLLTGVLQQELNLEEHKLFAEEMSDTSQDTSASSGQSKRRRVASEAGASSSSTAETKSTGSKRRKR